MPFSVGLGLTNACNLRCAHCYRSTDGVYALSLADVRIVCESLPVGAVGLGTGENALHPQFLDIVAYLRDRGVRLSIASNGYSLNTMPEGHLRAFRDVELSVDYPTPAEQDRFRGEGNWRDVHKAMGRCLKLGIEVSLLATMMSTNYDRMDELARLAQGLGVNLRVNAYQPVYSDHFTLSYEQFWEGYRRLLGASRLVSCSEPVVRAVLGLGAVSSPCARESLRVTPQRKVAPCVYWPRSALTLDDLQRLGADVFEAAEFRQAREVPHAAQNCACQGGCASRRTLLGDLDRHDAYCPWVRGQTMRLDWELAPPKELMRARNYCTTILM